MDLRRADTWSIEGKGGKSQFLCRVGGVLGLFLLEDHPAYECVPFQLSLWDTEMQLTMLVAGGSPALSLPPQVPPCPSSPSSQASPKKQSFSIVRGLGPLSRAWGPCPGQAPGQSVHFSQLWFLRAVSSGKAPENRAN